jgi:probable HAF family extracellular repeat protein
MDALGGRADRRDEQRDGWRLTDLELLPGGQHGRAVAVNDEGMVIGRSDTDDGGISHAVMWQDGRITDLGTLGGWDSTPCDLNRQGVIIGHSETRPGRMTRGHPFIWRDGQMTDLSDLGATPGFSPTAINDHNWVVGSGGTGPADVAHALVWKDGEVTDLGILVRGVYQRSHASDIDNEGRIVGYASVDGMNTVPVMWEYGQIRRLGDLDGMATAINSQGEVLGHSNGPFGGHSSPPDLQTSRPMIWTRR